MYVSESEKAEQLKRWIRRVVVGKWHHRAFTLTHLSLQVSELSDGTKIKKTAATQLIFYQTNGAGHEMFMPNQEIIELRRADFLRLHDYALNNASLRDFCIIRVPMKCGLRPGEVRCLRWKQVDFSGLTLNVVDSKKYETFPVPMDPLTADYLGHLKQKLKSNWVFPHDPESHAWKHWTTCLSYDAFDKIVKKWARLAGCQSWQRMNLYLLRHFFAANWAYPADGKRPGNLHALSKILRHKSLAYTQVYLSRLVFYEDLQAEYNRLQTGPFVQGSNSSLSATACGNEFFDRWCRICDHQPTCRWIDQAMASPWAEGCRFFKQKTFEKEEMEHNRETS
jgi:integrase